MLVMISLALISDMSPSRRIPKTISSNDFPEDSSKFFENYTYDSKKTEDWSDFSQKNTYNGVTKRNGLVPLIPSNLFLNQAQKNTLKEMCLKYYDIYIEENCPNCFCKDTISSCETNLLNKEKKDTLSTNSETFMDLSRKRALAYSGDPSLKIDSILDEEDVEGPYQVDNLSMKAVHNEQIMPDKDLEVKNKKILEEITEEELIGMIEDEFDMYNDATYSCHINNLSEDVPSQFNFVVRKKLFTKSSEDQFLTAEKLRSF